jgi:hypothetical protein
MVNRKSMVFILTAAFIFLASGSVYYYFTMDKEEHTSVKESTTSPVHQSANSNHVPPEESSDPVPVQENKYYVIYIRQDNGAGSSFVPETLNPDFSNSSDFNVRISFDDDGNIINDGKIIEIDHFKISDKNKETIKKISGEDDYDEALKEIEERVLEAKKDQEESKSNE